MKIEKLLIKLVVIISIFHFSPLLTNAASKSQTEYTDYDLSLEEALDFQMNQNTTITDKYNNQPAYVSADYVRLTGPGHIAGSTVNVRKSPSTDSRIAYQLDAGTPVHIIGSKKGTKVSGSTLWYKIKYKEKKYYVHSSLVTANQVKSTTTVNVRSGMGTDYHIFGQLHKGDKVDIKSLGSEWHEINYKDWRQPTRADIEAYLNPDHTDEFQHLRLDTSVGVSASELNSVLEGNGTLAGQGEAFISAAKKHGINEAYLIAHAFLETGHGTSTLATGVEVGKNKQGTLVLVTKSNRKKLTDIKTTYNMFGIGAVDSDPLRSGATTAYENGWYKPKAAIKGGAAWIGSDYIYNSHQQNTLYKMKWNPNMTNGYAWKQYATDIAWAEKQTSQIKAIYAELQNPTYHYDIPKYN